MNKFQLINEDSEFNSVILANGEYPQHNLPKSILRNASQVVCCDGAALQYIGKPTVIIGDGDSLPDKFKSQYSDIIVHISEQEDNDLTKATKYIKQNILCSTSSNQPALVAYLGATGKREDHTLANIFLLPRYKFELGIEPVMITDNGYFMVAEGDSEWQSFEKQQVSIFNLSCNRLESTGLRWNSYAYKELWQGSLNESLGSTFSFKADGKYIVYRTIEAKSV
jgi:thiamine pyrophosphokinase